MNIPADPNRGEDILAWARAVGRALRAMAPREGPDIYPQIGSTGTSYALRQRGSGSAAIAPPGPFAFSPQPPPSGQTDTDGPWGQISKNSWLMNSVLPTDKITISGLGAPFQMLTTTAPWRVWLELNVTGLSATPPTAVTATIKNALDWNPEGLTIFPNRFVYNTDDGTPRGSTMTAPPNTALKTVIIPIGYIVDPTDETSDTLGMAKLFGIPLTPAMTFVQQLNSHLLLVTGCYSGSGTWDCIGWPWAPQPAVT